MKWATAVKEWNSVQFFKDDLYGIPKKGGDYYDDVKAIMEGSTHKKTVDAMMGKIPEPPKMSGAEMAAYDNAKIMKKGNWREVVTYYENKYPFLKLKSEPEPKPESKPEPKPESKPEPKPESKPESKSLELTRELQRILNAFIEMDTNIEIYKRQKNEAQVKKLEEQRENVYDAFLEYAIKKKVPIAQRKKAFEESLQEYRRRKEEERKTPAKNLPKNDSGFTYRTKPETAEQEMERISKQLSSIMEKFSDKGYYTENWKSMNAREKQNAMEDLYFLINGYDRNDKRLSPEIRNKLTYFIIPIYARRLYNKFIESGAKSHAVTLKGRTPQNDYEKMLSSRG